MDIERLSDLSILVVLTSELVVGNYADSNMALFGFSLPSKAKKSADCWCRRLRGYPCLCNRLRLVKIYFPSVTDFSMKIKHPQY